MRVRVQAALSHELFDTVYFPHNIDFRGRAYPMPPHLNHMGADICRGLLQFSEARPLGEKGFEWLLIHLANVCGVVDKQSFARRMEWSLKHLCSIVDSADRPLSGERWWLRAENPWTALAVCTDIACALRSGDVSTYCSKLPVHQDGSCNGLQHYAALGLDASGAQAVNLLDGPEPQDVYGVVAGKFADLVAQDAAATNSPDSQYAQSLLGHTDRKLVKQTVMTTVYGVTMRGARDQVANRYATFSGVPFMQYLGSCYLQHLDSRFCCACRVNYMPCFTVAYQLWCVGGAASAAAGSMANGRSP